MAQLGELERAKALLRRPAGGFGEMRSTTTLSTPCLVAWLGFGGSVRLKRPMRPLCGSVRLKRLMRPLGGSVRLKRPMGRIGGIFVCFLVLKR
jgi:hypothetical protein